MRVALNVEQLLYRSPGGVGRYTAQLATLLPANGGDEVVAFTARHSRAEVSAAMARFGVPGPPATILGLPRPVLYEAWHRFGRPPLAVGDVDVIHAPSVTVPPRRATPLVVTVHDAASALFPEAFTRRGLHFHRLGLAAAARRADLVITVSQTAAAEIVDHSAIGSERIRVVANGVDPVTIDPAAAAAARARLGVADRPYVLWVGSLEPRKNVRTLVAAVAVLARRLGNGVPGRPRLVLAGYPGWLSDDLIDPADRAALGDDLVQLGILAEDDLWALYAGAELLGFPSRHEGFGYPVLEAMTQGIPVVCSDIAVLREVGGPAARYVAATDVGAWADAMDGLLADPRQRQAAALAGRAWAARFAVANSVAATRAVYGEVTGSS
ncbi:MAG: glycosyltransferase family 4 protein [Actinomycetota bacterium]|nr:glycosyltransferase family 4 protein [Actinomycetota bacterium]